MIRKSEIIGVFNIHALKNDAKGRKFLAEIAAGKSVEDISGGKQSSVVLADEKIYISRISSFTLFQRGREGLESSLAVPPKGTAREPAGKD